MTESITPAAPATTAPAAAAVTTAQPAVVAAATTAAPVTPPAATTAPAEIKYEAFKLPEGVALDEAVMGDFQKLATEHKLPQDVAQKFVDLGAKMTQGFAGQNAAAIEKAKVEWLTEAKADTEIGGEKFESNAALANNVFNQFGTPKLGEFLKASGLGNHPELVRWGLRVARAIGEDRFTRGNPPNGAGEHAGQTLEERASAKLWPTGT